MAFTTVSDTDQLVILQYGQDLTGDMDRDAWAGPGDRRDITQLCMDWNLHVEQRIAAGEPKEVARFYYVKRVA